MDESCRNYDENGKTYRDKLMRKATKSSVKYIWNQLKTLYKKKF